jgi:DNA-binding transcriptional regulator YhcF (GntR family)
MSLPNAYAILRVADEFTLRAIDVTTEIMDGDFLKGLVWHAIWTANVRDLTHTAANRDYGGIADLPPDALRRPISVGALASTLRLPRETARRYAAALVGDGWCVNIRGKGLVVPASAMAKPVLFDSIGKNHTTIARFMIDLKRAGFDFAPYRETLPQTPSQPPGPAAALANIRAVLRIDVEFLIDAGVELARAHGDDIVAGMIYLAIGTVNVGHITGSALNADYGNALPPDEMRRPVAVLPIAKSLRLPYETVRRHTNRFVRDGICKRIEGQGLIVTQEAQARFEPPDAVRHHYAQIVKFIGDLQQAGLPLPLD